MTAAEQIAEAGFLAPAVRDEGSVPVLVQTDGVFRVIGGKPFVWLDPAGVTHACEGADVHPGIRLLWTRCERDVPADEAHFTRPEDHIDCPKCRAALDLSEVAP